MGGRDEIVKNGGWGRREGGERRGDQTHNGHEGSSNRDIADMKGEE